MLLRVSGRNDQHLSDCDDIGILDVIGGSELIDRDAELGRNTGKCIARFHCVSLRGTSHRGGRARA